MLEWYRVGESYDTLMDDCAEILVLAAQSAASGTFRFQDRTCDPFARPERLSVAEAFERHAGIDLLATLRPDGAPDAESLRRQAARADIRTSPDDTWSDMLSKILTHRVEPQLGMAEPPSSTATPPTRPRSRAAPPTTPRRRALRALRLRRGARQRLRRAHRPRRAARKVHRRDGRKERVHGERYPLDEDFLAALAHMPQASGIALGFDRLVMLATGAPRIEEVLWAPVP
jgi:lysyl-tRNA synthetase class 2